MIIVAAPPVISAPTPVPSRNVMVWGDQEAMDTMRKSFEANGWRWAAMLLGEKTPAFMLVPPAQVSDVEITKLINDVNQGKYCKLTGGYAQVGSPETQQSTTQS